MSNSPMRSLKKNVLLLSFICSFPTEKWKRCLLVHGGREGGTPGKRTKVFLHGVILEIRKGCFWHACELQPCTLPRCWYSGRLGNVRVQLCPRKTALEDAASLHYILESGHRDLMQDWNSQQGQRQQGQSQLLP